MTDSKGVYGQVTMQYEETFGTNPATPDTTVINFRNESLKSSQNLIRSDVMTGNRHVTRPSLGNIDVSGDIATELGAYPGMLFAAAMGSVKTVGNSGTGEALGTALTTPTATINAYTGEITISAATHGLIVGDSVKIEGITAPTGLNDTYLRVIRVPGAGSFVCRTPLGISGTFTLGAGSVKKVTTPATTYLHTFAAGGGLPSLLIEKGFLDIGQYMKYLGCVCGKMSLNGGNEGPEPVSFSFSGKSEANATASFDAAPTDLGKTSFDAFEAVIAEGGSGIATVSKYTVELDNSLDTGKYLYGGAGARNSLPYGKAKVSGSLEAIFQDMAVYNKAVAGTESSLKITYTKGTGAGTAGNEKIEIFIPELHYKREAPVIAGEGGVMVSMPFEAFYHNSSEGTGLQIKLYNTQLAP